eukprot:SM000193S05185  [mRNA]  locus=s193:141058:145374:- [translate_table: standard]
MAADDGGLRIKLKLPRHPSPASRSPSSASPASSAPPPPPPPPAKKSHKKRKPPLAPPSQSPPPSHGLSAAKRARKPKAMYEAAGLAVAPLMTGRAKGKAKSHKSSSLLGPLVLPPRAPGEVLHPCGVGVVAHRKVVEAVLDKLQRKDTYGVFSEPVDVEVAKGCQCRSLDRKCSSRQVPDYYDVISSPMDFGTIRKKLLRGAYTTWELFMVDVDLICTNAMTYNKPDTIYHRQGKAIQEVAVKAVEAAKVLIFAHAAANGAAVSRPASALAVGQPPAASVPRSFREGHDPSGPPLPGMASPQTAYMKHHICGGSLEAAQLAAARQQSGNNSSGLDSTGMAIRSQPKSAKAGWRKRKQLALQLAAQGLGVLGAVAKGHLLNSAPPAATTASGAAQPASSAGAASAAATNDDSNQSAGGVLAGLKDGRRPLADHEHRRRSFSPRKLLTLQARRDAHLHHQSDLGPGPGWLQGDHAYARSLVRFAAALGPAGWKAAEKKLQRCLGPHLAFGPGWLAYQKQQHLSSTPPSAAQQPAAASIAANAKAAAAQPGKLGVQQPLSQAPRAAGGHAPTGKPLQRKVATMLEPGQQQEASPQLTSSRSVALAQSAEAASAHLLGGLDFDLNLQHAAPYHWPSHDLELNLEPPESPLLPDSDGALQLFPH